MSKEKMHRSEMFFENVDDQVVHETDAMVRFAMAQGLKVNPSIVVTLNNIETEKKVTSSQIKTLVNYHNSLVVLIKPALPKNIMYLEERERIFANRTSIWQSKFPMLRKLIVFSMLAIFGLIFSSLSETVSVKELAKGLLNSNGIELFINFMFLGCAAAIGASFLVLSNIRSKFTDGTYHPDENGGIWVTIVLGIIGGIIMSEIITIDTANQLIGMTPTGSPKIPTDPDELEVYKTTAAAAQSSIQAQSTTLVNNKLMYALLGGFSSKLVYNVMNKLITAVESLIAGGPESQAQSDLEKAKNQTEMEVSKVQLDLTGQMSALQSRIQQQADPAKIKEEINKTINSVFGDLGVVDPYIPTDADSGASSDNSTPPTDPVPPADPTPPTVPAPKKPVAKKTVAKKSTSKKSVTPATDTTPSDDDAPAVG